MRRGKGYFFTAPKINRNEKMSEKKQVRLGLVGAGGMGTGHVLRMAEMESINVTAICDLEQDRAENAAKTVDAKVFTDASEMYASGLVDAVFICTPHYAHTPLAVDALKAGLHVLTEKPIAVHKADAQLMIDEAAKHPELKFSAMFNMRTLGLYQKLKQLINSGELGKITRATWIITNWFRSQAYYDSGGWRATWEGEGGGVLTNQCPHQLDLYQWLFGMPSKIRAFGSLGKYHHIEVEDEITAYCEFPNGATGSFIANTAEAPGTNRLEIACDRGLVVVENNEIVFHRTEESVSHYLKTTKERFAIPGVWECKIPYKEAAYPQHDMIIRNFADAILNDVELIAPAVEGINSVELANAMVYSVLQDVTVDMPLDANAYKTMLEDLIKNSEFKKEVGDTTIVDLSKTYNNS
jgi:predicted dehydrogenase